MKDIDSVGTENRENLPNTAPNMKSFVLPRAVPTDALRWISVQYLWKHTTTDSIRHLLTSSENYPHLSTTLFVVYCVVLVVFLLLNPLNKETDKRRLARLSLHHRQHSWQAEPLDGAESRHHPPPPNCFACQRRTRSWQPWVDSVDKQTKYIANGPK